MEKFAEGLLKAVVIIGGIALYELIRRMIVCFVEGIEDYRERQKHDMAWNIRIQIEDALEEDMIKLKRRINKLEIDSTCSKRSLDKLWNDDKKRRK